MPQGDEIIVEGIQATQTPTGSSGLTHPTGTFANSDLSNPHNLLTFDNADHRSRNFGLGLNIRDTDTTFEREIVQAEDRTKDLTRDFDETLLTQAQCDQIQACIDSLMGDLCGTVFDKREDLIECADKIFDLACDMENKLKENIVCQIENAKCQFFRQANSRWAQVSRAVGSSRNTFVIQQQDTAMVELTRVLASLRAELFNNATLQSQQSLERAFSVKSVSRLDNYDRSFGNMISLWQLVRGAKRTVDENVNDVESVNKTSNENSFQDVTTFDWAGKYSEQVSQTTNDRGTYDADYDAANTIAGLLGILNP